MNNTAVFSKEIKYSGICGAGIVLNIVCLSLYVFLGGIMYQFIYNSGFLALIVGVIICGASGLVRPAAKCYQKQASNEGAWLFSGCFYHPGGAWCVRGHTCTCS